MNTLCDNPLYQTLLTAKLSIVTKLSCMLVTTTTKNGISLWCNIKARPNGLASRCKSKQVCKTRPECVRTCNGGPIRKSARKFTQVANLSHIQLTCDQLVSTYVGLPNDELAYEFELDPSHRKSTRCSSTQVGGQTKRKLYQAKTCVDLRFRLARDLGSERKMRFHVAVSVNDLKQFFVPTKAEWLFK